MLGELAFATAIADPSGEKATPLPSFVGSVAGSVYLVPKPELDQGYAVTNGVVTCPTATYIGLLVTEAFNKVLNITRPLPERRTERCLRSTEQLL